MLPVYQVHQVHLTARLNADAPPGPARNPPCAGSTLRRRPGICRSEHAPAGTGWQAGETVAIDIYETSVDPLFWEGSVSAVADTSGNISNSNFVVQQSFLGQGFLANATGQSSGLVASAVFTDSPGPGTAPVSPPTGGFGIDGDLQANTPTIGIGDAAQRAWMTES